MLKNLCFFSQPLFSLPPTLLAINQSFVLRSCSRSNIWTFLPLSFCRGLLFTNDIFPNRMQPISHWQKGKCSATALVCQTTGPLAPICSRLSAEDMSGLWLVSCQGLILNVRPLWCDRHRPTRAHPFFHLFIMLHVTWSNNIEGPGETMPQFPCRVCRQTWTALLKGRFHQMYHVWSCFLGLWCVQMCFILTSHTDSLVQMCSHHGNLTRCTSIGAFARLSGGQQRLLIELIWRQLTSGPPVRPPRAHAAVINCSALWTSASAILLIANPSNPDTYPFKLGISNGISQAGICSSWLNSLTLPVYWDH